MTTSPSQRLAVALAGLTLIAGLAGCAPLVVGGVAVGAGMMATDRRSSGAQLDDQGIELRAGTRIREVATDTMNVSVISYNRMVLLTGSVGNEAERRRAEEVVRSIENVRSVVNELRVGPASTFQQRSNDTYISGKVKASLLDSRDVFANSFKVTTEQGTVYLMGLATRRETDRATEIVRGVSGVEKVVRVVELINELPTTGVQPGGTGAPAVRDANPATPGAGPGTPLGPPPGSVAPAPAPAPATPGVVTSPVR